MTGSKRIRAILFFILSVLLVFVSGTSCSQKETPNKELLIVPLGAILEQSTSCRIDFLRFQLILEKDIDQDIRCLQDNLKHFSTLVSSEDASLINHREFQQFIDKFFPEIPTQISAELIRVVFQVFSFILQDPIGNISVKKIDKLAHFISFINQDVGPVFRRFRDIDPAGYWKQRDEFHKSIRFLSNRVQSFIQEVPDNKIQMDMTGLAKDVQDLFALNDARSQFFISSTFILKKLFLGGKGNIMTQENLLMFFDKLPKSLENIFDVVFIDSKPNQKVGEKVLSYYQGLEQTSAFFYPWNESEVLVKHSEFMLALENIVPLEPEVISIIGRTLQGIKPKVFGGNNKEWRFEDIRRLVELARHYFGGSYFNSITCDFLYRRDTEKFEITLKELQSRPEYYVFPQDSLKRYWKQFHLIVSKYRYFKDVHKKVLEIGYRDSLIRFQQTNIKGLGKILFKDELKMYQSRYQKALEHLNHVMPIRGLLEEIIPGYNSEGSVSDIYVEEIQQFLDDLAPAFGKKRGSFRPLAEEIFQTADFFQFQSNGNGKTDIDELTEYLLNVFYALKLGTLLYTDIVQDCLILDDGRIEISCYRESFLTTFFGEQHYLDYFKNLLEDPHMQDLKIFRHYLADLEEYSKSSKDTKEESISKTGLIRLMVAFLNIEGLFAHFDEDKNGEIGKGELKEKAYPVFKHLIIKISKGKLSEKKEDLVLSAFLYLVKYGSIPNSLELYIFHKRGENDDIVATRKGVARLLVNAFKGSSPVKNEHDSSKR